MQKDKTKLLTALHQQVSTCQRCELHQTRNNVVFHEYHGEPRIFLIGEAPGELEDQQGKPFVGRSGKLLRVILEQANIQTNYYIANTLCCRPPNNATPTADQISACRQRLNLQIKIINPDMIIAVGRSASTMLNDSYIGLSMSDLLGLDCNAFIDGKPYPYSTIYHPSYLLRNRAAIPKVIATLKEKVGYICLSE